MGSAAAAVAEITSNVLKIIQNSYTSGCMGGRGTNLAVLDWATQARELLRNVVDLPCSST